MNVWNWHIDFPEYKRRLEAMAVYIRTGFHEYRVSQLSLIPKEGE